MKFLTLDGQQPISLSVEKQLKEPAYKARASGPEPVRLDEAAYRITHFGKSQVHKSICERSLKRWIHADGPNYP